MLSCTNVSVVVDKSFTFNFHLYSVDLTYIIIMFHIFTTSQVSLKTSLIKGCSLFWHFSNNLAFLFTVNTIDYFGILDVYSLDN